MIKSPNSQSGSVRWSRTDSPIRISSVPDLENLRSWKRYLGVPETVVLELKGVGTQKLENWEGRINRILSACGCEEGAILTVFGLVGYGFYLMVRPDGTFQLNWEVFAVGLGVLAFSALFGKIFGLFLASLKLRRVIRDLALEIERAEVGGIDLK